MEDFNTPKHIEQRLQQAMTCLEPLQPGFIDFLTAPKKSIIVNFPVQMD